MSNIQYAVCHLQRGSGSDSGMSCHIERKDAKGKTYVPDNADAKRTHLNRELIKFPQGVLQKSLSNTICNCQKNYTNYYHFYTHKLAGIPHLPFA